MANTRQRNGRVIEYTNQTPFESDFLYSNMYNMVNSSYLASAILGNANGNNTLVSGLACTQNSSPNLSVLIGAGVMFNFQNLDATAYGVIGADTATTDNLYKPYIQTTQWNTANNTAIGNLIGLPLTFTPPGSGTTNYLLQATFLTTDTDSLSRPYYNPANPAAPIYNTAPQTRWDTIFYSLKSATSPAIPTPDAGYVGLYVISVASGATQILNSNIVVYSGAPFITESLTQKVSYKSLQSGTPLYGSDTGTANAYAVTATPAYTQAVAGSRVDVKIANTNTGASTLNVSSLGAFAIRKQNVGGLAALAGGELQAGMIAKFEFDGTYWQLLNPASTATEMSYANFQQSYPVYAADSGTANTYVANPPVAYGSLVAGSRIDVKILNGNTGASTLNVSSLGATAIQKQYLGGTIALQGNELQAGIIAKFEYDGTNWQLLNPASQPSYIISLYSTNSASQSFNATGATIQWDSSNYADPYSVLNANGTPVTGIQVKRAGKYQLIFELGTLTNTTTPSAIAVTVYVNSSVYVIFQNLYTYTSGGLNMTGSTTLKLNTNDIVTLYANATGASPGTYTWSTATANTNFFDMYYLGN